MYSPCCSHLTLAILNFARLLKVFVDFLAVSVLLAYTQSLVTCRQGINRIRIRLCNLHFIGLYKDLWSNGQKISNCAYHLVKVAFLQKVRCVFQISKSPKKIFQKTILNLKFKFPANNNTL